MDGFRRAIKHPALGLIGARPPEPGAAPRAPGPGLFGSRSVASRVHADFASMMIGGTSALLLQMLHPSALGAVWDHTDFRDDLAGRLKRTARFVSATTYGAREDAERAVAKVRSAHARVRGTLPDGTAYSADDPVLLAFVHVAEVSSFLAAHLRYRDPFMSPAEQDRYFEEMSVLALRLGATAVPCTRRDARAFLEDMRPRLRADARTREVARILRAQPAPNPAFGPVYRLMFGAAVELLPGWAARMHGFGLPPHRRPALRAGAMAMVAGMRWAMSAPEPAA